MQDAPPVLVLNLGTTMFVVHGWIRHVDSVSPEVLLLRVSPCTAAIRWFFSKVGIEARLLHVCLGILRMTLTVLISCVDHDLFKLKRTQFGFFVHCNFTVQNGSRHPLHITRREPQWSL